MVIPVNANDPRVKRTRQLLLQAFMALLEEKHNINSISVQDIAERAMVNRSTFYDHFEDKYAFLESWMRTKFQQTLESHLPAASPLEINTLRSLILVVFDFFANFRRYQKPIDKQFESLFQASLQQELYQVLLNWLEQTPTLREAREATALVISWAIFGPAVQWSREEQTSSTEEMACQVLNIVVAGLSAIVTIT